MQRMAILVALSIAGVLMFAPLPPSFEQRLAPGYTNSRLRPPHARDSAAVEFANAVRKLTSPALEERKASRRAMQKFGYASALAEEVRGDGLAAFASYARLNMQVQFALWHRELIVYLSAPQAAREDTMAAHWLSTFGGGPMPVTLFDDWSMPEDPWK